MCFYGASAKAEVEVIWLPLRLHEAADAPAFFICSESANGDESLFGERRVGGFRRTP